MRLTLTHSWIKRCARACPDSPRSVDRKRRRKDDTPARLIIVFAVALLIKDVVGFVRHQDFGADIPGRAAASRRSHPSNSVDSLNIRRPGQGVAAGRSLLDADHQAKQRAGYRSRKGITRGCGNRASTIACSATMTRRFPSLATFSRNPFARVWWRRRTTTRSSARSDTRSSRFSRLIPGSPSGLPFELQRLSESEHEVDARGSWERWMHVDVVDAGERFAAQA